MKKIGKESGAKWTGGQNIVCFYVYVCKSTLHQFHWLCICMCSYCDEGLYPLIILRLSAAKRRKMYSGHSQPLCVCIRLLVQANRFVATPIYPILSLFLFVLHLTFSLSLSLSRSALNFGL